MSCSSCELMWVAIAISVIVTFSKTARYYLKMFLFLFTSLVVSCLPIPFMLLRPRDYRNALFPAWACVQFGKVLGVTFEVRGLENIDKKKGAVVLINHQSGIDLMVLGTLWPLIGRATVIVKKEIFYILPFGIASYLWGTLFINRQNGKQAQSAINKESKAINEKQAKILFFPEGTRSQKADLLPFKKGPFHVAVEAQCVIQPVVVSRYHFIEHKTKSFGRGHNIIHILPEVKTAGMTKADVDELMKSTYTTMQNEFTKLSEESKKINNVYKD